MIRLDGQNIREYALADLRKVVGVVAQDTYLFNDTIRGNLLLARADASDNDIEQALQFTAGRIVFRWRLGLTAARLLFALLPPARALSGLHGYSIGHAVQPAAYRLSLANRCRLAGQDEKRRLEGILRVLFVLQDAPAHAPHGPPEAFHQAIKGRFTSVRDEAFQQLPVSYVPFQFGLASLRRLQKHGVCHDFCPYYGWLTV